MTKHVLFLGLAMAIGLSLHAGDLKKDYFGATKSGAWAEYGNKSSDGQEWTSTDRRQADDGGQIVVEESVRVTAGAGAGTDSKNIYTFPKSFNLAHDWLSEGKFIGKMTMQYGTTVMPVAEATLDAIKKISKDYRGAVAFEAVEEVDGHTCDRYAYAITIAGPAPSTEKGQVWLDATVPFGVVKQAGKFTDADGKVTSSYQFKLQASGQVQAVTAEAPAPAETAPPPPAVVSLLDGYNAGRVGIEVQVEAGSGGKHLQLAFVNKTEADIKIKLAAGALEIPASSPVDSLKIVIAKAAEIAIPAGETSEAVKVDQRSGRGAFEGKFHLSVYEGTPLFSGSCTRGTVSK
jgi:hypothetical protein